MKKARLTLAAIAVSAGMLVSFTQFQTTSIKGTVSPADKAVRAWAVSADDTLNTPVENGTFELKDVKSGTYSIIIEAREPFANTRKKDVVVGSDNAVTDVGEIKLRPKDGE